MTAGRDATAVGDQVSSQPRPHDAARGGGDSLRSPTALADTSLNAASGVRRRVDGVLDRVGLGHLAHRVGQVARYGAVSILATLTSLTVLGTIVATATLTPGWANIVATCVGTVPSFELNRRWVWGRTGRRSLAAEIGPFCVLSLSGLALSTLLVSTVGHWATSAGLDAFWRTAAVEVANVAAFGSLWLLQFLVLDRVLFARRPPTPSPSSAGSRRAPSREGEPGSEPRSTRAGGGVVSLPDPAPAPGAVAAAAPVEVPVDAAA